MGKANKAQKKGKKHVINFEKRSELLYCSRLQESIQTMIGGKNGGVYIFEVLRETNNYFDFTQLVWELNHTSKGLSIGAVVFVFPLYLTIQEA